VRLCTATRSPCTATHPANSGPLPHQRKRSGKCVFPCRQRRRATHPALGSRRRGDASRWPVAAHSTGEAIGKCLRGTRRPSVAPKRHELHLEALVRLGRAIEAAMERDEHSAAVARGELSAGVEQHSIGGPVCAEGGEWLIITCTINPLWTRHSVTVATVLGREDLLCSAIASK